MSATQSRRDWLLSDSPTSRKQARWGQNYRIWLALKANRLAMVGLWIVVILALLALFAPLIAPYDPLEGIGGLRGARALVWRVATVVRKLTRQSSGVSGQNSIMRRARLREGRSSGRVFGFG